MKMICSVMYEGNQHHGAFLCYDNPLDEELEQEFPLLKWSYFLHTSRKEIVLEHVTLILLSTDCPLVFPGVCVKNDECVRLFSECGQIFTLTINELLTDIVAHYSQYVGMPEHGIVWNGKELTLQKLKSTTDIDTVSGTDFVREWIAQLVMGCFPVTLKFMEHIRKKGATSRMDVTIQKVIDVTKTTNPAVTKNLFWMWFQSMKPRNLQNWFNMHWEKSTVSLKAMRTCAPMNMGLYLVGLRRAGESFELVCANSQETNIPCFQDEEPSVRPDWKCFSHDFGERKLMYTRNLGLTAEQDYNRRDGNVFGIYGDSSFMVAALLPFHSITPRLWPCRSTNDQMSGLIKKIREDQCSNAVAFGAIEKRFLPVQRRAERCQKMLKGVEEMLGKSGI